MPPGKDEVVMLRAAGATAMLRGLVVEVLALSVTLTVKLAVPGAVGVPLIVPVVARESPVGRLPVLTDQV